MYRNYGYRSGTTNTMRGHLRELGRVVDEYNPRSVLDIGCNDGTFLMHAKALIRVGIDPSDAVSKEAGCIFLQGFFPEDLRSDLPRFDVITTLACFYDSDDPVAFARAVKANLADDGVWIIEVADLDRMISNGDYASICHEHLLYFDVQALADICQRAGLVLTRYSYNDCNGGTLRAWVMHDHHTGISIPLRRGHDFGRFAEQVSASRQQLLMCINHHLAQGHRMHLLGASTKTNTVLQFCEIGRFFEAACDRDPNKHGRRTPGTNIPIVSEAESRSMRPDVYVTCLQHFKHEIIERELAFLNRGGSIVFALPRCVEMTHPKKEILCC
jgi:SAM-dependent methyltransferase